MKDSLSNVSLNIDDEKNETIQVAHIISEIDAVLARLKTPGSEEFVGQMPLAVDVLEDTFTNLQDLFQKAQKESVSIVPVVLGGSIKFALDKALSSRMKYTQDIAGLKSLTQAEIKKLIKVVFSDDKDQLQVFYAIFN